jgi:hypothetical protein
MGAIVEGTPHRFTIELTDYQLNYVMNEFINTLISRKYMQEAVAEIKPEELLMSKDVSALAGKKITSISETPKQMFRRIQSNIKKRDSQGRFLSSKKKIKHLKK